MEFIYLLIPLAPLFGAIAAGLFGKKLGRTNSHRVTIAGVGLAFILSVIVAFHTMGGGHTYNGTVYTWAIVENIRFEVGFLIDNLSSMMMIVVTFVSLMVHIYTIGYMHDDPGYQRFFSYISLFTFSMLMLVMSNNFMQLFFGWEAVGLVSYLLIGFWFKKETAIFANMKAFLVNRVGDFGFVLGIGGVLAFCGTLDYAETFARIGEYAGTSTLSVLPGIDWKVPTFIAILLFIGAMGKSAQVPLHVWLPDSMEGPTPISALIHAATMVTAGIFMVARMSPIFELSDTALNFVMVIGATTAFFMGLVGIVQNDIKRVVAYSTLSQLGYMTAALGASAYSAGVFHLMTHAFFKALLFLAAGSVIMAMHHEQDIRKMGGLKKYMPITYWTSLIGSLALIGFPGFSGFFSKDVIIEAIHESQLGAASYAYPLVLLGVFVTAFYSFRMFFLVFHGKERFDTHDDHGHGHDDHGHGHGGKPHESPWVVTMPLILLAIPSIFAGYLIDPMVVGNFFHDAIYVNDAAHGFDPGLASLLSQHNAIQTITEEYHGAFNFILHGLTQWPFWLSISGVGLAAYIYLKDNSLANWAYNKFHWLYTLLDRKYYADDFNQNVFAKGSVYLGNGLWALGERVLIDGLVVNGSARVVGWSANALRHLQTGYLYHYAFAMILGLIVVLTWFLFS